MAIDRTAFNALVDDDGSGNTGTPWNKAAIAGVILDPTDAALAAIPSGAPLPTADVGQILASQGPGVPPVFKNEIVLIDPTQPADQRRWRIHLQAGGYLVIDAETDAGAFQRQLCYFSRTEQKITTEGVLAAGRVSTYIVAPGALPFGAIDVPAVGMLVNYSDSTTNTPGATITGGGTFNVLGRYNGTVWKVVA